MIHLLSPIKYELNWELLVDWLIVQEETGKLSGNRGDLKTE